MNAVAIPMETLELKIVSPHGTIYDQEDVVKVTVPTEAGEITVHPRHMPMVSVLKAGEIMVYRDGNQIPLAISAGVLEIRDGSRVYVLADTAEHAHQIDIERAERAKARAEELLKQQHNIEDVEFARIQAQLEKELARLGVAKKYKA